MTALDGHTDTNSEMRGDFEQVTVADAMHHGVITCPHDATLREVAKIMAAEGVHCVVVFDEHENGSGVWGIVSDLDLAAGLSEGAIDERTAGEIAATPVVTVLASEPLSRAAELMAHYGSAHLVTLDASRGQPVGVVSTLDLARVAGA